MTEIEIEGKEYKFIEVYDGYVNEILVDNTNYIVLYKIEKCLYFVVYSNERYIEDYLTNEITLRDLIIQSNTFIGSYDESNSLGNLKILKPFNFKDYILPDKESYLGYNYINDY